MGKPRNKFERRLFEELTSQGVKFGYEVTKIPYTIEGTYNPDFTLRKDNLIIEAKGHFRPEAMRKMAAVKRCNPTLDIRIVFYSFNKKYIRWCEKYNFPYAIGSIPKEWIK